MLRIKALWRLHCCALPVLRCGGAGAPGAPQFLPFPIGPWFIPEFVIGGQRIHILLVLPEKATDMFTEPVNLWPACVSTNSYALSARRPDSRQYIRTLSWKGQVSA